MSPERKDVHWFPAKTWGWGWGPPRVWQGWAVLAVYFALFALGFTVFVLPQEVYAFLAYQFALCGTLIAVCWWKGERPRWRWGRDR